MTYASDPHVADQRFVTALYLRAVVETFEAWTHPSHDITPAARQAAIHNVNEARRGLVILGYVPTTDGSWSGQP